MTRVQEVMHLVRYDVLRTRWWWMAYMVVVGVAAFLARVVETGFPAASTNLFALVLGFAAIAFAATLTRDSSPLDSRAFLAAKPLSATSRAIAKVLQLGALVTITAAVAGWATAPNGWPLQNGAITLLPATTTFLLLVLAGGYVGLVTRTAATATLVWGLGVLSAIMTSQLDGTGEIPFAESGVRLLALLVPLCLVASALLVSILANPYFRRPSLIGGIALATVSLVGQCAVLVVPVTREEGLSADVPMTERVSLIQLGDSSIASNTTKMRIEAMRDDRYYRFEDGTFVCMGRRADGSEIQEDSETFDLDVQPPDSWVRSMLNVEKAAWNASAKTPLVRDVISLGPACSTRIAHIDRVALVGNVVRYRLERVVDQPFRIGRLTRGNGQHWWLRSGSAALELHHSSLLPESSERSANSIAGLDDLRRRPVIIVIDSTAMRVYRVDQGGYSAALAPVVLPALYRGIRWYELRQERDLERLLRAGTPRASIAVYRWVRDGSISVLFQQAGGSWFQRRHD